MKTINTKEFIQWIMDQPDDRPVNMDVTHMECEFGCAMIEYARDLGLNLTHVGAAGFYADNKPILWLENPISDLVKATGWRNIKTFQDLKEKINVDFLMKFDMMPKS